MIQIIPPGMGPVLLLSDLVVAWWIVRTLQMRLDGQFRKIMAVRRIGKTSQKSVQDGKNAAGKKYLRQAVGIGAGLAAVLVRRRLLAGMAVWLLATRLPNILEAMEKKRKRRDIGKHIYRIYRFLSNQMSSGIKPHDALKSAFNIPEEGELRECLVDLSAKLELTNDLETAFASFRTRYASAEAESLYLCLKQGIETGMAGDLLEKLEEYYFSKYLGQMQAETENSGYRALAAAVLFSLTLCALLVIPLLMEAGHAVSAITGS